LFAKVLWCRLLLAEGNHDGARREIDQIIRDFELLRSGHPDSLDNISMLSEAYRLLASMTTGQDRHDALLKSAGLWHAWPATTFTQREEQKDLSAARASAE
jgi:hypothetical protein